MENKNMNFYVEEEMIENDNIFLIYPNGVHVVLT